MAIELVQLDAEDIAIIGIPLDHNSSYLTGAAEAPPEIRKALHSPSSNLFSENGRDIGYSNTIKNLGDLEIIDANKSFEQIKELVSNLLVWDARVISLGGDHSITYPIMQAFSQKYDSLTILQLDAHGDLYDELDGNRHSHACPFARIMEESLVKRLVQIGNRCLTEHQRLQADRFGVEIIEMKDWHFDNMPTLEGPLYISLDMDVLDPAFAPGVSHYEPGGFSSRDVINIIQHINVPIVGADIVEFNPKQDYKSMTAMVAAKFLKEIACRMLSQ